MTSEKKPSDLRDYNNYLFAIIYIENSIKIFNIYLFQYSYLIINYIIIVMMNTKKNIKNLSRLYINK